VSDYTPVYENGSLPFTMTASAAVTGGQVVIVTGIGTVGPSAAASGVVAGVAAHDAAINARVSVWPLPGLVHESITPAGTTAGFSLSSSTAGGVDTGTLGTLAAAGTLLGTALNTATAGLKVRWLGK
jgi:hypothetical protein